MAERKYYDHESGTALKSDNSIFDVTAWREAIQSLLSGTITVEQEIHKKIHDGSAYSAFHNSSNLASGSSINIFFSTPLTPRVHLYFNVYGSQSLDFEVLEGPTVTANSGTHGNIAVNKNRDSSNTSVIEDNATSPASGRFSKDVSVTNDGVTIVSEVMGSNKSGHGFSIIREVILKASTDYVFRLTSQDNSNRAHINLDWYEGLV